jgi:hypothetical protein
MLIPWLLLLLASPRGFDITDESYYLLNLSRPEDIRLSFSMFGIVLSPLYDLSRGNIAVLRGLSVIIWLGVSVVVSWLTMFLLSGKQARNTSIAFEGQKRFLLTLLPSAGAALYYTLWLVLPSYNWMALTGLALFWGGFLLWLQSEHRYRAGIGAGLFAFAAAIVFWAKPTSAPILVLYPLLTIPFKYRKWRQLLGLPVLACGIVGFILGMSLPLLQGLEFNEVVDIFARGVEHQQVMKLGQYTTALSTLTDEARKVQEFFFHNTYANEFGLLWAGPLILAVSIVLLSWDKLQAQRRARIFLVFGCTLNLIVITLTKLDAIGYWAFNSLLVVVSYVLAGEYAQHRTLPLIKILRWVAWMVPIFILNFAYVFATSNSYAFQSAMAAYFFLLAISVVFLNTRQDTINTYVMYASVPTLLIAIILIIYISSLTPYRQGEPVWAMDHVASITGSTNELIVSEETARYIDELQTMAEAAGFQDGTPLIDLTGHTPGAAYVLSARAYAFPWLLGDYSGSDSGALYVLRQWSQEYLRSAWILTVEHNAERPISLDILGAVGLDFPANYTRIGLVRRPESQEIHSLWKPQDDG